VDNGDDSAHGEGCLLLSIGEEESEEMHQLRFLLEKRMCNSGGKDSFRKSLCAHSNVASLTSKKIDRFIMKIVSRA